MKQKYKKNNVGKSHADNRDLFNFRSYELPYESLLDIAWESWSLLLVWYDTYHTYAAQDRDKVRPKQQPAIRIPAFKL